jgi:hypothetical protein
VAFFTFVYPLTDTGVLVERFAYSHQEGWTTSATPGSSVLTSFVIPMGATCKSIAHDFQISSNSSPLSLCRVQSVTNDWLTNVGLTRRFGILNMSFPRIASGRNT